jgi:RHS repeat-associated protein
MATAGAWVWNAIYDPFGAVSYIWSSPAVMDIRFPGQWFQLETGLAYNWHRHYDASLGRYIQPDPLGLDALLRDGPSAYGYVGGNPLGYVDIDGLARRGGLRRGGERGATGGASGLNTDNPYKHCREVATDPNKIECQNHQDGKWIKKKKPADWDQYKNKFCPTSLYPSMVFGGIATACLLQPEICIPAAAFSLPVAE